MKKFILFALLLAFGVACSPSPDSVKEKCLKDKNNAIFYGDKTPAYCDCVYEKLKEIADTTKLKEEIIDSVSNECDAEFTTMDTQF